MRIALLIAAKDLRQRFRDRSALIFAIVAPLGLALIFSRLIGPSAGFHATWVVVDLDGGSLATVLRDDVIGGVAKAGVADVTDVADRGGGPGGRQDGTADAAFVIPQGFTEAIQSGRPTTIEVVGSRSSGLVDATSRRPWRRASARAWSAPSWPCPRCETLAGASLAPADAARIAQAAGTAPPPVSVVEVTADLRQLDLATFFSASMAILFLFFSAQTGLLSVFEERRLGTLRRILAGPVGPGTVLVGKLLGAFAMSVVAMATLVVATTLLIGADWGPVPGVAPLIVAAIVAALGVSTLVISFTHTVEAAASASAAVGITLAIIGGSFAPSAQSPEFLGTLALLTPHGWFLRGLGDLHGNGGGIVTALPAIGVLLAIGLVTGAIGILRARRLVTV